MSRRTAARPSWKKTKPSQRDVAVWFDIAAAVPVFLAGSQKRPCFDEMVARRCFLNGSAAGRTLARIPFFIIC